MLTPQQTFFADIVRKESGIVLDGDKGYLLDSRLGPLAKEIGCQSVNDLYDRVKFQMTPDFKQKIVEALTTNESLFFRDMTPFRILQREIIPNLKDSPARPVNVWCAAASTGQEPYSLVLSFLEKWSTLTPGDLQILATDIDNQVIERGKNGVYSQIEVNRGLPVLMLTKYFRQEGTCWEISPKVREFVSWRNLNLTQPFFVTGPYDLIFIRNVLIYFTNEMKAEILTRISKSLKPGGILFLGSSESTVGIETPLETKMSAGGGVYYQLKE